LLSIRFGTLNWLLKIFSWLLQVSQSLVKSEMNVLKVSSQIFNCSITYNIKLRHC
jgi:hypothetical protein